MSQLSTLENGGEVMRFVGFRFCPTDEELVLHYLRRKVYFLPVSADTIPEFEVSRSDPWDLPGDSEDDRYFFSTKDSNRATPSGYWIDTGINKPIVTSGCPISQVNVGIKRPLLQPQVVDPQVVVGGKKTLVFYTGKSPNGTPTDWIMHEYHLVTLQSLDLSGNAFPNQLTQENWVVCRISRKMKGINDQEDNSKIVKKKCTGQGRLDESTEVSSDSTDYDSNSVDEFDHDQEEWCSCVSKDEST